MFDSLIAGRTPSYEGEARWGPQIHLSVRVFPCAESPPDDLVTSVRGVVFKGAKVVVVDDGIDSHVMPGGRREPGETISQTLARELREECGWSAPSPRLFAMICFRHLSARPDNYRYPYPDFLHLLFVGEAGDYRRGSLKRAGEIETGSRLVPISRALAALSLEQRAILGLAMGARRSPSSPA
ncbi:MAG: NUDIX domain-containing protein [Phenylobacterium sp.]|uniref:NUDIX hydrolase n=1 Tax=Phenylobacterium sp. TaxID=1871053 RepID=UPI0027256A12|nr:NUDIX domain-containing protein [Phenylobacterium sp.]MDO8911029.1 NUDIX domain-containing protein [Phenylobacterium sp.]MDP3099708.1 NUDIX domain-containing protein [Phenylobacterium sp.]